MKVSITNLLCGWVAFSSSSSVAAFRRPETAAHVPPPLSSSLSGRSSSMDHHQLLTTQRGGAAQEEEEGSIPPVIKASLGAGVGAVALAVLKQQFWPNIGKSSSSSTIVHSDVNGRHSNTAVVLKTVFSVALTSAGLWALLYGANLPEVTSFYSDLGVWHEAFGLAPILYVAFWFLTYAASFATELLCGTVHAASRQQLRPTETPSSEWYESVQKPAWNPPAWVFPVMWLLISKPTQFLALRQVFLASVYKTTTDVPSEAVLTSSPNWTILALYTTHLALGNAWNDVFFGYEKIGLGLVVISLFWATLAGTAYLFYQEATPWAGYLMIPTLVWVTIATALNLSIYNLNKDDSEQ